MVSVGVIAVDVAVGVGVSVASEVSVPLVALAGSGQSSGASGYSIGLSAIYSSGRLLWKGVGRLTSESEARPSLASESESLYHIVP